MIMMYTVTKEERFITQSGTQGFTIINAIFNKVCNYKDGTSIFVQGK